MVIAPVSVLFVVVFISRFFTGNAETNEEQFKNLLTSKDVGNTLFSVYRSILSSKNMSTVLQQMTSTINQQCLKDLTGLSNTSKLQYIDAAGKPQSGILYGNTFWFGSVNECHNITNAHYCLSTFTFSFFETIPFTWSVCLPSSCGPAELKFLLETFIFPKVTQAVSVNVNITLIDYPICPPKPSYTTGVIVMLVISGIVLFLCLVGTILDLIIQAYDNYKTDMANINIFPFSTAAAAAEQDSLLQTTKPSADQSQENDIKENTLVLKQRQLQIPSTNCYFKGFCCDFLLCFSLVHNTKKIFNTNVPSTAITSINGIRVISITWVILGHTYMTMISSPFLVDKLQFLAFDSKLLSFMPVINGFYSVDSFFFLSGLLVAYTCMRKMQKSGGKFNWLLFYVHRFFRLTPAYMYVILFSIYLKRFLATGPFFYTLYEDKACSKYWWTNLIYINNFYPNQVDGCIDWTWYLANDMQFFVITPPLLYILYRYGWKALVVPLSLLGCSCIVIGSIVAYYNLDPFIFMKGVSRVSSGSHNFDWQAKDLTEFMEYIYLKPYCRIQPYLVGFILGYAMNTSFNWMRKPNWIVTIVGWIVSFVVGMLLVYGPYDYISPNSTQFNQAEKVLYAMFERLIWGLVVAWVTYACHYHAGGLVQKFLSAKFWIPLSRLTYSVYLIHAFVLVVTSMGALGTIQYDTTTVVYYFITVVVFSFSAAFILSVGIEFPCNNIEDMVIKYLSKV